MVPGGVLGLGGESVEEWGERGTKRHNFFFSILLTAPPYGITGLKGIPKERDEEKRREVCE